MAQDSDPSGQKIAVLLDCDDRMAKAFTEAGYVVERGTTGFVDGTRRLPRPLFEADVVVYDLPRPVRYDHAALDIERGKRPVSMADLRELALYADDAHQLEAMIADASGERPVPCDIADETPRCKLYDGLGAAEAGALLICFVNRAMMPASHAKDLCGWVGAPSIELVFSECCASVARCSTVTDEPWRGFFDSVASPLLVTMDLRWEAGIGYFLDRSPTFAPLLTNRKGGAHALLYRLGSGALIVLPEFQDNASAAVRLATEIWPVLRQQGQALPTSETAQSEPGLRDCPCGKGKWEHKLLQYELATKLAVTDARIRQVNNVLVEAGARVGRFYAVCTCCDVEFYRKEFALGVRAPDKGS